MQKPYYRDAPSWKYIVGHAPEVLKTLDRKSVDCVVTSPPYYGLRDYGIEPVIWDGDNDCEHEWGNEVEIKKLRGSLVGERKETFKEIHLPNSQFCQKCGATLGQLGLEPTPELYIQHLCDIFDDVWNVLKGSGSLWVNIADSYWGSGGSTGHTSETKNLGRKTFDYGAYPSGVHTSVKRPDIKPKSLIGIPERFVLEMMNRGWIRRNTIIWHKPNCMPSSASDRFTVDFEYFYFFTKKKKYYFEQQFEPYTAPLNRWGGDEMRESSHKYIEMGVPGQDKFGASSMFREGRPVRPNSIGRNKRCVWEIPTTSFSGAHFAVFPEALVEIPIKACCPKFICKKCGKPREKIFETNNPSKEYSDKDGLVESSNVQKTTNPQSSKSLHRNEGGVYSTAEFKGYTDCGCNAGFVSGVVLDPFAGTFTVGKVARDLGRSAIGIDISEDYKKLAVERARLDIKALGSFGGER